MKNIIIFLSPLLDIVISPFVFFSSVTLWLVRRIGVKRLRFSRQAMFFIGVFPIRDHYYEPKFNYDGKQLIRGNGVKNNICWMLEKQKQYLINLIYSNEITAWNQPRASGFFLGNGAFESGDAEILYNIVRYEKPKRIIEIGSGYSTLILEEAIKKNIEKEKNYNGCITCIEPFEMPWLEELDVHVIRSEVQYIDLSIFDSLSSSDILFVDSSHVIRPGGDVLYEIFEILPRLQSGVIVHFHDIFSPFDYPEKWIKEDVKFWNEQYLIEAFLTNNDEWEIILSLNYLFHSSYDSLKNVALYLTIDREPGSLYIRKK